jgi:quercetin dioxygenase-like cupin family protein
MRLFDDGTVHWEDADPGHFTGKARLKRVTAVDGVPKLRVYRVEFEPRARTNWHTHSGVQLLYIDEGQCRFQKWGESVQVSRAGDVVYVAPNEKHWHGADPVGTMVHIAVNINAETTWMEPVTDEQYSTGE